MKHRTTKIVRIGRVGLPQIMEFAHHNKLLIITFSCVFVFPRMLYKRVSVSGCATNIASQLMFIESNKHCTIIVKAVLFKDITMFVHYALISNWLILRINRFLNRYVYIPRMCSFFHKQMGTYMGR